ncbi:hypothetical protein E1091_11835 [Micromonospora fluostatini]|uniref:Uncharacterized protein n=1 Tax=Micromonospora fluostatini TaxID=1629071 RepID=A0ABY2DG02_9ACTN|nr:hypothetical protein E1091_11835 [Micromonospora fluostatini]
MSGELWALLAAAVGGGGLAGVVGTLITSVFSRPKVRADAVALLTDSALKQVNELQERTAEAEREATAARNDLLAARQQIRELTVDIDRAMITLRTWRTAILSPDMTLEQLRVLVLADHGDSPNGRRP